MWRSTLAALVVVTGLALYAQAGPPTVLQLPPRPPVAPPRPIARPATYLPGPVQSRPLYNSNYNNNFYPGPAYPQYGQVAPYVNPYANPYVNAYANPYANLYANPYAYANPYVNTYVNPYASTSYYSNYATPFGNQFTFQQTQYYGYPQVQAVFPR